MKTPLRLLSHPSLRPVLRGLALPFAAGALVLAVSASSSCNSTTVQSTAGDFISPSGLAVASASDRDLLFIASSGGDELRALMICNTPALPDGGVDPADTCPTSEDYQFLPGPIRVFPASLQVGDRPVRLAGVRLLGPDGGAGGAVIVAGADPQLKLVDAANVIDAEKQLAGLRAPQSTDLVVGPPVDVISVNAYSPAAPDVEIGAPSVRAYALTQSGPGQAAHLVALQVAATATGPKMTKQGRCAVLDPQSSAVVQATRLAAIPRSGALPPSGNPADDAPFDTLLYVADGTPGGVAGGLGDGALELDTTQPALNLGADPLDGNPAAAVAPCAVRRRIPATSAYADDGSTPDGGVPQPLRSLALSPRYFNVDAAATPTDGGPAVLRNYPPGALLLGATNDGKIVFVRTDQPQGGLAPLPPFPYVMGDPNAGCVRGADADGGAGPCLAPVPPMEPLRINGGPASQVAREVSFLKPPSAARCTGFINSNAGCTVVEPGSGGIYTSVQFELAATVTSSDGATYFLDADSRRFISDFRDGQATSGGLPGFSVTPTFSPLQPNGQAGPTLAFPDIETDLSGNQILGGVCCQASLTSVLTGGNLNAGVTSTQAWRLIWHGIIPGLNHRGGTMSRNADGSLHVAFPQGDPASALTVWQQEGLLGVGDVFAVGSYSQPGGAVCAQLQAQNQAVIDNGTQNQPEFVITALSPFSLDAVPCDAATCVSSLTIDPVACLPPGATVGATLELRSGSAFGDSPWLVFEGTQLRGRTAMNKLFFARGPRFDYPLDYALTDPRTGGTPTTSFLPTVDKDVSVAFSIVGLEPITPQSFISFVLTSGQSQTHVSDTAVSGAFAGPSIVYTSPKVTNLVFTSVTGANSVLQIDPANLQITNGVLVYR